MKQLEIAESIKKPVIIHCVNAYNELIEIRNKSNQQIPWIIHWFNSSQQLAYELIKRNCYLSYGIMLFKENSKAFKIFPLLPLDYIFFETDDAGISIDEVYFKASEVRKINLDMLQKIIENNFLKCFNIKL